MDYILRKKLDKLQFEERGKTMIELRAVTQDNIEDVLNLDILEHQEAFVSSNACSLAQAYVYHETVFPFAIYDDNMIIGFIMLGYLKKDGIFIFSWHHTLNYCVAWSCTERKEVIEDDKLVFHKSYFDESYFTMPVHDSEIILCNRKISTYVNALAKSGFVIEQMIEQNDRESMEAAGDSDDKTRKAKMVPISVCFKARKL